MKIRTIKTLYYALTQPNHPYNEQEVADALQFYFPEGREDTHNPRLKRVRIPFKKLQTGLIFYVLDGLTWFLGSVGAPMYLLSNESLDLIVQAIDAAPDKDCIVNPIQDPDYCENPHADLYLLPIYKQEPTKHWLYAALRLVDMANGNEGYRLTAQMRLVSDDIKENIRYSDYHNPMEWQFWFYRRYWDKAKLS